MYSDHYSHKIIYKIASILVVLMLVFQPAPAAYGFAADPPPEDPPAEESNDQGGGTDGQDGGDAGDGVDGQEAGDGGDGIEEGPADGQEGEDTGGGGDGGDGEGAQNDPAGTDESNTGDETTTVVTGDAESTGDLTNNVDLTVLQTLHEQSDEVGVPLVLFYVYYDAEEGKYKVSEPSKQAELDEALLDGVLDPVEYLSIITPENDTFASTTNEAIVENEVEVTAETGTNSANNNDNVVISTGDSTAVANVLNVVNTNIFDSEGLFLFLDNLGADGVNGNLDFREFDIFNPDAVSEQTNTRVGASDVDNPITAICPTCGGNGDLTINVGQDAQITNDVVVRSGTGQNLGLGNAGATYIDTGDAYAAANTINVANTNIVDSNYLLLTFNNFGDFNNDIVFPAAEEFVEAFGTGGQTTPDQVNVNNTNTTDVGNNVDVNGITGDNTAQENFDGGTIVSGDAHASNNTLNSINSNLFGGASFSILLKVHGDWNGEVLGVPDDMYWRETPDGIEIVYDSEGGTCPTGNCGYDAIHVNSDNNTQIANNVSVVALTGENQIDGGTDAVIQTGDAYAAANTINVANTNVIGKNWLMAVVNIFGDFNGNITFGQPNLWVGAKVSVPANAGPGDTVTYEYTVMNNGDAPSSNVCLRNRFDHRHLNFNMYNPLTDTELAQGNMEYCIGTVDAGEVREISRTARIGNHLDYGSTFIENEIEVVGGGDDPYPEDNTESLTFELWQEPPASSGHTSGTKVVYQPSPDLSISKVNSSPFWVRASSTVDYRIIIKNNGAGSAYDAVLVDTLYNEDGEKQYTEYWNLGEIYPGEEIEVMYSTFFSGASEPGVYRNEAHVEALGGYHNWLYGHDASTDVSHSDIKIVPPVIYTEEEEEVIEVVEASLEIVETIPDPIEESEDDGKSEAQTTLEEQAEVNTIVARAIPDIEYDLGPFHGPFYYEDDSDKEARLAIILGPYHDAPEYYDPNSVPVILGTYHDAPKYYSNPVVLGPYHDQPDLALSDTGDLSYGPTTNRALAAVVYSSPIDREESEHLIALLALSMFVLRNPRSGRKNSYFS